MRVDSANAAKHNKLNTKKAPELGTKLRELWDLLQIYKGEVVTDDLAVRFRYRCIEDLRDFYGLDIRCLNCKGAGRGRGSQPGRWVLAGEWFGKNYVDYIAQKRKNIAKVEAILTENK